MSQQYVTFSFRLPAEVNSRLGELAIEQGKPKNAIVNELILEALDRRIDFEEAVRRFVFRQVTMDEFIEMGGIV